ncbi:MAG: DUF883 C-terminal domain-containing protein [Luteolibacter sp.]
MSNPFTSALDPDTGITQQTSVAQAANDLRAAAGEKAREFAHTAQAKSTEIKDKALESAQQFKAAATEKAQNFKAAATDKAQHFKESATAQWEDTRVKAKEFHSTGEEYIRANPTKAVLTALGVGFLIGLIVRR